MTEETLVRKAESRDLEDIVAIIKDAKALLKAQNSSQWQEGYPNRASIEEDLRCSVIISGVHPSSEAGH